MHRAPQMLRGALIFSLFNLIIMWRPESEFFDFIDKNKNSDCGKLRLFVYGKAYDFDMDLALTQIECRRKCKTKLSSFLSNERIVFPDVTASEQSSHEGVAKYNAYVAGNGKKAIDMTAGLGIDSLALSHRFESVTSCELDSRKAEILQYNCVVLGINNVEVCNENSIDYLKVTPDHYDVIFVDPARRGQFNSRVYDLKDCRPDILPHLPLMKEKGDKILIKASPMLDVARTLRDISDIDSIHAVSVEGECKELLIVVGNSLEPTKKVAVNLDDSGNIISSLSCVVDDGEGGRVEYADEKDVRGYLYEPDASVMKMGMWEAVSYSYPDLRKIGKSSHLFVSDSYYPDFPGRVTAIEEVADRKKMKMISGDRRNVVTRNYPMSPEEIRKKYHIKEGNKRFLYATRLGERPLMILSSLHENHSVE